MEVTDDELELVCDIIDVASHEGIQAAAKLIWPFVRNTLRLTFYDFNILSLCAYDAPKTLTASESKRAKVLVTKGLLEKHPYLPYSYRCTERGEEIRKYFNLGKPK
jgi:hypothetical protein